uniref:Reverse transcriptase zinc-binding domain-containing protein n=1 Tax=Lactuca sativa TaxID=4236 RepID=A0A9R1X3Y2_LACSA|nr:hypothetical protein LSAT_V11C700342430 [Lactuca sativa]
MGRSFWYVDEKQDLSWSWRNLMRLRPQFRNHFYSKVGNGANTFMWYDDWHHLGALSYVLSPREIANAGFRISDKISLIPQLNESQLPVLDSRVADRVLWRKRNGQLVEFDLHQVWIDLSSYGQKVPWVHLVWFKQHIPRHSFILWLAIQERLMTQDRMRFWDKNKNLKCTLCNLQSVSLLDGKRLLKNCRILLKERAFKFPLKELHWLPRFIMFGKKGTQDYFAEARMKRIKLYCISLKRFELSLLGLKIAFWVLITQLKGSGVSLSERRIKMDLMTKGIDGHGFSNFPLKIALLIGLIPIFWRNFPLEVVFFLQMGFIPIIGCFPPWQLGVSTSVGATASSVSKWIITRQYQGLEECWRSGFLDLEDCGISASMSSFFVRRWFTTQGHFRNTWIILLENCLKTIWNSLGKKEVGEKLKTFWKWWDLLGHLGFSIILSWRLKTFSLAKEDIGKFMEDLKDIFRNRPKNFVMDNGLNLWSLWVLQVKIGKKFNNCILEKIGKYCMKSTA